MPRRLAVLLLILIALIALAAPAAADLEIGVPPGTPLDWGFPERPPTGSASRRKREREATSGVQARKEKEAGATVERRPESDPTVPRPLPWVPPARQTPLGYARITTVDMPGELPWTAYPKRPFPLIGKKQNRREVTGGVVFGRRTRAAYPPRIGVDLHWLTMAVFVRKALHPNQILDNEALAYLLQAGPPARAIVERFGQVPGWRNGYFGRWIFTLEAGIAILPGSRPRVRRDLKDNHRDQMLRLTGEELAAGYAYEVDGKLGARVLALPRELAISLLAAYAIPEAHPLLQQNAVALLARYQDAAATEALFAALKKKLDAVARRRALLALAQRGVKAALPVARKLARHKAPPVRALGLRCLRAIGEAEDQKLIAKSLLSGRYDTVMTALRALAGLRDQDQAASLKLLQTLSGRVRALSVFLAPMARADNPDTAMTRRDILRACLDIALARLGDAKASKRLLRRIKTIPNQGNGFFITNRRPIASPATFGSVPIPAIAFLLESLPLLGDDGASRLSIALGDAICEPALRLTALRSLEKLKAITAGRIEALLDDADPRVSAAALFALARLDPEAGAARAAATLEAFEAPGRRPLIGMIDTDENQLQAGAALRILERSGRLAARPLILVGVYSKSELKRRPRPAPNPMALPVRVIEDPADFALPLINALGAVAVLGGEDVLAAHLADSQLRARGEAALQLADAREEAAIEALCASLGDKDPWLRLCAYHALRLVTRGLQELDVDWLDSNAADRFRAQAAVRSWLQARPARRSP